MFGNSCPIRLHTENIADAETFKNTHRPMYDGRVGRRLIENSNNGIWQSVKNKVIRKIITITFATKWRKFSSVKYSCEKIRKNSLDQQLYAVQRSTETQYNRLFFFLLISCSNWFHSDKDQICDAQLGLKRGFGAARSINRTLRYFSFTLQRSHIIRSR